MTQPVVPQGGSVDASDVIEELVAHVGRLSKENAILRVQLRNAAKPAVTE